ncbi:MAG TPA: histidine kinase [Firmicutes bacterium]|nr:histidine kinase [Bacillota bacterium]
MRKVSKQPTQSIRNKFMFSFLTMIIIFTSVSFCSYYSQRNLLSRINSLLANSIKLREFSSNIDNIVISLEKFLIERSSDMLRSYHHYYQEVESEYTNLQVIEESIENYLLLKNIKTMTRLFLQEADSAVRFKRARDSAGYSSSFGEVLRYNTNIKWAVDRLITKQLEENSMQYLLISERINFIQRLGLLMIVLAIIFSILSTIWIGFRLTKPLKQLVEAADTISRGEFQLPPLPVSSNDEIAVVSQAFNEMAASIGKLISEIKNKSDLEKKLQEQEYQNLAMKNTLKEAELHALQSQINPHFLFNTLNAGVQLAIMEDADKTADFIDKISKLLRYSLRQINTAVTIREETNNLENYFFILKTRYGSERFDLLIEVDPAIADFQIPLLTIQPIVENALIHGVEQLEEGGEIKVRAYQNDESVIIDVSDNGLGMDSETVKRLQEGRKVSGHTTGLGLWNVRERLRLFFGRENLLEIMSIPKQGTTIRLVLPKGNTAQEVPANENPCG